MSYVDRECTGHICKAPAGQPGTSVQVDILEKREVGWVIPSEL
jgi:hypothetical protein